MSASGFVSAPADNIETYWEHTPSQFISYLWQLKIHNLKRLESMYSLREYEHLTFLSGRNKRWKQRYFILHHEFNYFRASCTFGLFGSPQSWVIWKTSGQAVINDFEKQREDCEASVLQIFWFQCQISWFAALSYVKMM